MTTDQTFVMLVRTMRVAQKAYFRERTPDTLKAARHLERLVDHALETETYPRAQPSLFDKLVEDVEKV